MPTQDSHDAFAKLNAEIKAAEHILNRLPGSRSQKCYVEVWEQAYLQYGDGCDEIETKFSTECLYVFDEGNRTAVPLRELPILSRVAATEHVPRLFDRAVEFEQDVADRASEATSKLAVANRKRRSSDLRSTV